jgi:hypothetical protein
VGIRCADNAAPAICTKVTEFSLLFNCPEIRNTYGRCFAGYEVCASFLFADFVQNIFRSNKILSELRSKWARKLIEITDPSFVSDFNQNWNMPTDINKTFQCQVQLFSPSGTVTCAESHCHGKADRHDFAILFANARKRVGVGERLEQIN